MTRPISPLYTDYAMVGGFTPNVEDGTNNTYVEATVKVNGRQIYGRSIINKTARILIPFARVRTLTSALAIVPDAPADGTEGYFIKFNSIILRQAATGLAYTVPANTIATVINGSSDVVSGEIDVTSLLGEAEEDFTMAANAVADGVTLSYGALELLFSHDLTVGTIDLYCEVNYDWIPLDVGA